MKLWYRSGDRRSRKHRTKLAIDVRFRQHRNAQPNTRSFLITFSFHTVGKKLWKLNFSWPTYLGFLSSSPREKRKNHFVYFLICFMGVFRKKLSVKCREQRWFSVFSLLFQHGITCARHSLHMRNTYPGLLNPVKESEEEWLLKEVKKMKQWWELERMNGKWAWKLSLMKWEVKGQEEIMIKLTNVHAMNISYCSLLFQI